MLIRRRRLAAAAACLICLTMFITPTHSGAQDLLAHNTCVPTLAPVSLRGRLVYEATFGPPGFGENPRVDERRIVPFLILSRPIDICRGTPSEFSSDTIPSVRRVQVIFSHVPPRRRQGLFIGHLSRGDNPFHLTPVVLSVEN